MLHDVRLGFGQREVRGIDVSGRPSINAYIRACRPVTARMSPHTRSAFTSSNTTLSYLVLTHPCEHAKKRSFYTKNTGPYSDAPSRTIYIYTHKDVYYIYIYVYVCVSISISIYIYTYVHTCKLLTSSYIRPYKWKCVYIHTYMCDLCGIRKDWLLSK